MPQEVDWSTFEEDNKDVKSGGGGGGAKSQFIRFQDGSVNIVRPFGKTYKFYKIYVPKTKRSIIVSVQDKDAAAKALSEHSGEEHKASMRFATHVIDRADGEIRILEQGYQVFENIAVWSKATGINPGTAAGVDWRISAKGNGGGKGDSAPRKYTTVALQSKPFTDDERAKIDKMKAENQIKPLKEVFKETPLEDVIEKAFGAVSSGGGSSETTMNVAKGQKVSSTKEIDW